MADLYEGRPLKAPTAKQIVLQLKVAAVETLGYVLAFQIWPWLREDGLGAPPASVLLHAVWRTLLFDIGLDLGFYAFHRSCHVNRSATRASPSLPAAASEPDRLLPSSSLPHPHHLLPPTTRRTLYRLVHAPHHAETGKESSGASVARHAPAARPRPAAAVAVGAWPPRRLRDVRAHLR
jgi:hypothetical protein